jgi:hypothetical protein
MRSSPRGLLNRRSPFGSKDDFRDPKAKSFEGANMHESSTMLDSIVNSDEIRGSPSVSAIAQHTSGDRNRTERRYREAVKDLEDSLKSCQKSWRLIETSTLNAQVSSKNSLPALQASLESILETHSNPESNLSSVSKCNKAIKEIFKKISPFAKNFLQIAREGQQVFNLFCLVLSLLDSDFQSLWDTV